jgi:1-acyl-sn-glycerol-3-phosphate acyltransferase
MSLSPTPKSIRLLRILRVALHLAWGVFIAGILFRITPATWHSRLSQRWSQKMLAIFGVEYHLHGNMPDLNTRGLIMVSNHMSWLDIWLLYAIHPLRFISKADVRGWPVIGFLAQQSGTLFIQRERRHHTAAIIKEAAELLTQGDCIGLFPEGTTTDGTYLRPFHTALFQAAVIHQAPVVLFAIRYHLPDGSIDTAPAYHGGLTLLDSFRSVLARRRIQVEVTCLGTLDTHGKTRREISNAAESAIATHLNLPAPHKQPETPADPPAAAPSTARPTDTPYPRPHADSPH